MAKPPKELEDLWYAKLADSGFVDIENTDLPGRPLKEWHSRKFIEGACKLRGERAKDFQVRIERLRFSPQFDGIVRECAIGKLSEATIKHLWDLHCEGKSRREIAKELKTSPWVVHRMIVKLEAWAALT